MEVMKRMGGDRWRRKGFTGLEAAIVLTAFVVVAAVFSYVVLNAGFFTTEKSKEVIHSGVDRASQSVELVGYVIGYGNSSLANNPSNRTISAISFVLQCTAGATPMDLNKTVISYADDDDYLPQLSFSWRKLLWIDEESKNSTVILPYEKVQIYVNFNGGSATDDPYAGTPDGWSDINASAGFNITTEPGPNEWFTVEVKPPVGAVIPIKRMVPPFVTNVTTLF